MFRITFTGYNSGQKIQDIKDMRALFLSPTKTLMPLTESKLIIERIYERGKATVLVSEEQFSSYAFNRLTESRYAADARTFTTSTIERHEDPDYIDARI